MHLRAPPTHSSDWLWFVIDFVVSCSSVTSGVNRLFCQLLVAGILLCHIWSKITVTLMLLCFYKLWQQQYNACVLKMLLGLQLQQESKCKCLAKWISPRNSIRNHKTPRMTVLTRHLWLLSNVATWWINIKCVLHNGFVRVRTIHFIIGLYIS